MSRPDNLAYQSDQPNIATSVSNTHETYAYSQFDTPSLAATPSADPQLRFAPQPQPVPNSAEYDASMSHPPGEYTQYREYLASSRSTAEQLQQQQQQQQLQQQQQQQQQQQPPPPTMRPVQSASSGPIRRTWKIRAQPHHYKVEPAELARVHAPLSMSMEERRRMLRLQFQAQFGGGSSSPVTPSSPTPTMFAQGATGSSSSSSAQPIVHLQTTPVPSTSSNTTTPIDPHPSSSGNASHHVNSPRLSAFDGPGYPRDFSNANWGEMKAEHLTPPSTNMPYANSSSSSSEHLSIPQPAAATHAPSSPGPSHSNAAAATTVFIHSNLMHTSMPVTNDAYDTPELMRHFPLQTEAHRKLRVAMHAVLNSEWKQRNELEPTSQDILQFSLRVPCDSTTVGEEGGIFKYRCLLYHRGEECMGRWARAERMLAHIRGAIDLRPFACEGEGELDACNCGLRFFAEDTLQQHRKNTRAVGCPHCGAGVTPRNIKRHLRNNCPKSPQRSRE
ncbi:hypothetical protein M408DRAFT_327401 [Serendipita vermifera MAFF 305830]|uniref:Uncharacterized protein n=1 Tax=Serendipita vermifera MAFF 305830 TaxID=933852 RepID=A0A0C3BKP7_SERVB|nr:hypothetical protein M408DRAFT_327401 [Serendipita vermifera MAFF 305830]